MNTEEKIRDGLSEENSGMEKSFKKEIKALGHIFDFVESFIAQHKLDATTAFTIKLVVEELFTNMVKYNKGGSREILINLNKDSNRLIVSLTDFDVEPFDITRTGEYDLYQSLKERRVGGVGLHLVKQMVDKIEYEYTNRQSKITIIKHLGSAYV